MRKIISITLLISVLFSFIGCSSYLQTANGAYSDISLTRDPDGYTVKRLAEVKETGKAFWGIPKNNKNKKQGMIFRFNGINLDQANGFWPTLSMIGMSTFGSLTIAGIINPGWFYYEEYATLLLSTAITLPITGAINNAIWSNSAYQTAAFNLNSKLLVQNPDVDVFLNPKYEVYKNNGLWSQEAKIKANVMGATIIVDEDLTQKSGNKNLNKKKPEKPSVTEPENLPVTTLESKVISVSEPVKDVLKIDIPIEKVDIVQTTEEISDNSPVTTIENKVISVSEFDKEEEIVDTLIEKVNIKEINEEKSQISTQTIDESDFQVKETIESKKTTKKIVEPFKFHDFEVGDIVTFSQHISNYSVNDDFEIIYKIPDGVIYKISGDKLYINYILEGNKYRTRKNSDEVELVKKR